MPRKGEPCAPKGVTRETEKTVRELLRGKSDHSRGGKSHQAKKGGSSQKDAKKDPIKSEAENFGPDTTQTKRGNLRRL